MDLKTYKKDFKDFINAAFGVLLYGSCARGNFHKRSDIDICIVKLENDEIIRRINKRLGGKYDVKVFNSVDERMVLHRRWMHEKRAIIGEIGSL